MARLYDEMVVQAELPNGIKRFFSLAEYLAWREYMGIPEKDIEELIKWLKAVDNNLGRLNCWLSVQQFRREFPGHPAVKTFDQLFSRRFQVQSGL